MGALPATNTAAGRAARLMEIGLAIGSAVEVEALLQVVAAHLSAVLDAERSTLFVLDRARGQLWSRVPQGGGLSEVRLPVGQGIAGAVVATGRAVNLADAEGDPRFEPALDQQAGSRSRSVLCAPVLDRSGAAVGALEVINRLDGLPFDATDESVLAAVAAQVAVALENARLLAAERRKIRELDLLYALEGELAAVRDAKVLIDTLLARALDVTSAEAGAVLLFDQGDGELYFRTSPGALVHARVPLVPVSEAMGEGRLVRELSSRYGLTARSRFAVPLVGEGGLLGVLALFDQHGAELDAEDRKLLALLGGQAGRALERTRDLTARERNDRLRLLGQGLASLMHDLRSPLSLMLGYAEMLAVEADPARRLQQSAVVVGQVAFMSNMMDEVLAHLRGESKVLTSQLATLRFLGEVGEALALDLTAQGIELRIEPNDVHHFRADEPKLKRALLNLGRNAIEAMPAGGRLTLAAKSAGDRVVLSVSDSGVGIPAEIGARVFETFFTHGKPGGTGLGLTFVRQVVEAHGGTVQLKSEPGRGTTFSLELPQG